MPRAPHARAPLALARSLAFLTRSAARAPSCGDPSRRYGADPSLTLPGDEKASPTGLLAMLGCSGGDACGAGAADATDGAGAAKSDGDAGGATPASDGSGGAPPSGLFNYVCSLVIPN